MGNSVLTWARDKFGIEKTVVEMGISQIQSITHVNMEGRIKKFFSGDSKNRNLSKTGRNVKAFILEQADLGGIRKGNGDWEASYEIILTV